MSSAIWTIGELAARVGEALQGADYDGQASKRVQDVPDTRAIRYYTTLGIFDRPTVMRGRTALYGPRHLLQLVAIKRLQAAGDSLQVIQQKMLTASADDLAGWAAVPRKVLDRLGVRQPPSVKSQAAPREGSENQAERQRFWAAPTPSAGRSPMRLSDSAVPRSVFMMPLCQGVTLQLEGLHQGTITPEILTPEILDELRRAASPLVARLQQLKLAGPTPPSEP
jgi:DNA-binding transcriptional MerR regulator